MRISTACLIFAAISVGCVSDAVNQHAVNQTMSIADMRYQEVLDNLARIAHNNGMLPSYGVISGGGANVTNSVSADAATLFTAAVNGFAQETLNASAVQNPDLNWTIDPVVAEPSIEALKYACLWALYGPPPEGGPAMELLRAPRRDDIYGYRPDPPPETPVPPTAPFHFDVASQLAALPLDWLGRGCRSQVPKCACYKSHCGDTYVWVTPDHLADLSAFTLVVLDIATIYPQSLLLTQPTAQVAISLGGDSSNKISETWDARQEADVSGTIRISRPKEYRQAITRVPDIVPTQFTVAPKAGQPQFRQTSGQLQPSPGSSILSTQPVDPPRAPPTFDNRTGAQDIRLESGPTYASFAPAGQ